jgi:cystathionine beta-lyase/cystathionine gamma-synthase
LASATRCCRSGIWTGIEAHAGGAADAAGDIRKPDQSDQPDRRHRAITRLARAHGALTLLDNTFAGLHQHGQYPVDLFLHSLTKFASGHGDVMGGAVIGNAALIATLRPDFSTLGGVLDPHAAFLLQRGLKTYFVRYRTQCASAQRIAEFLASHPAVERTHYPGLPSAPGHALARAQMSEFGAVVSFDLRAGARRPAASPRRCSCLRWPPAWERPTRWYCRRSCSPAAT